MKKAIVDAGGNVNPLGPFVRFEFEGLDPLMFDTRKISTTVAAMALPVAFSHRLGDMAAIPKSDSKGNIIKVTEQMRRDAVESGIRHYESGTEAWELKAGTRRTFNPAIQKLAAAKGISYDEAEAWIVDQDTESLKNL